MHFGEIADTLWLFQVFKNVNFADENTTVLAILQISKEYHKSFF